ncbi:hypothetical protein R3X25_04885 [Lutibacter sp. TH_r2]|uniref:hypothetical protein n=1 Tax=Lutibacter sp. TH_r2 TaxID=3082083 RepID=UPI002955B0ED|nr:hypothetical protein [Lutibacter sp. TH_r2]MDV7186608.1 hypothetical protein [Lutibacter sp. TH_r2]
MSLIAKKYVSYLILLLVIGCQQEIDINEGTNPNTNSNNSETTNYYKRVGMYDGSFDDLIDNASCFSVELPVSLKANGIALTIEEINDYQLVETIFNQSSIDDDTIGFNFPITIFNYDYTQSTITNQEKLDDLTTNCGQLITSNLSAITCVDLVYPIKISLFNIGNDQASIITIINDQELYGFTSSLSNNEVYSINYPINVLVNNTDSIEIIDDSEFKSIINDCI